MKKHLFFLLLLPATVFSAGAQDSPHRLWLGFDGGGAGDLYRLHDEGGYMKNNPIPGGYYGFSVAYSLRPMLILETGAYHHMYWSGIHFRDMASYGSATNSIVSWQIPLRIRIPLNLWRHRLTLTPRAGMLLGINTDKVNGEPPDYSPGEGSGSISNPEAGITYEYSFKDYDNYHRLFPLAEGGLSLDYGFKRGLQFSLGASYQKGFTKITKMDITYSRNGGAEQQATLTSYGDHFRIEFGVRYPVSNIWQHERKSTEEKENYRNMIRELASSRWYVGSELGVIRNHFTGTNPVLYGNEKGLLFGDNDLSMGAYGGYRIATNTWLETGFYLQRFTNRYLIEDGTGVFGGAFRAGGEGFMQIPLRVKYRLVPGNGRFTIVPYAGLSLLTHTQGLDEYNRMESSSGNGEITRYETAVAYRDRKAVLLLNLGVGMEYSLFPRLILTCYGNYSAGFSDINRLHVTWQDGDLVTHRGDILFNGTNFNLSFGVKVPLGK